MPTNPVSPPFPLFHGTDGKALSNGLVYIGTAGQDPESNAITAYWDEALTIPALQPIPTLNGYISRAGTPSRVYVGQDYSITVKDSHSRVVYSSLSDNLFILPMSPTSSVASLKQVSHLGLSNGDMRQTSGYSSADDGGQMLYQWDSTESATADNGKYIAADSNGSDPGRWVADMSLSVHVKAFGAQGVGTDDSNAIQAAIDSLASTGGTVVFPRGDYRVSVTKGTNDKYGINIPSSNIKLLGEDGASIRRLSSDISTYALSFPLLLVGVADDNSTQLENIKVEGIEFVGEDTRHSISGNVLMDGRQAIWLKNVKGCDITGNKFSDIDSGAVYCQAPAELDLENTVFYNTTKCYDIKFHGNDFIARSHSTNGRALMHALSVDSDNVMVSGNYFEWCDSGIAQTGTYDDYDDLETDTYTDSNLGASVMRTGRGCNIVGNIFFNSSEHCVYLEGMTSALSSNTVVVTNPTVCNTPQFQIRGRGVSASGNTFTGVDKALAIRAGAMDVSFKGNPIQSSGDTAGGIMNIQAQGLTAYIDARSDYLGSYKPMRNISIDGNTLDMPDASQTNGVAIRLYTDTSDANYNTGGQLVNVVIKGNTINGAKKAILNFANLGKRIRISDNVFAGKTFTEAGFNGATTMNSLYVLGVDDGLVTPLSEVSFDNNTVYGFENILYDDGGSGTNLIAPYGVRGNRMDFIKNWDTANFVEPTWETMFYNNSGTSFLDRTGWFSNKAINNSLSDGTSDSEKKSIIQLVSSSDVRIYYDDAGGFKAL